MLLVMDLPSIGVVDHLVQERATCSHLRHIGILDSPLQCLNADGRADIGVPAHSVRLDEV
jgi:hypothetical protein